MSEHHVPSAASRCKFWHWLSLAALVIGLDQASKIWLLQHLPEGVRQPLLPFFNLVHAQNHGAAFSMFNIPGGMQRYVFLALALSVSGWVVWTLKRQPQARMQAWALSLIMGGALGNAVDRVRLGSVVDFIELHWHDAFFPAFNVADSAITVGAALLLLLAWREHQAQATTPASPSA